MLGHFPILSSSSLLLLLLVSVHGKESYWGWKVMQADIATQEQLNSVKAMDLDVWSGCSSLVIGKNDIRMQDTHDGNFTDAAIPTVSLIPDIETYIEYEDNDKTLDIGISSHTEDWHTKYHTYEQIVGFLDMYAQENVGVTYTEIGTTHEGNKIPAVVVNGPGEGPKKSVLIVGGLQARDWASTASILYFYRTLINYIQSDAKLANIDVHIIPVANPDGYIYSWTDDRLWRNNRRDNSDGSFGVDLNRNFGYGWGIGCPADTTSDTYCGTEAFSEPETQAIRDYITKNGQFAGAVEYSSYSQAILRPYALSTTAPPRAALLQTIADEWASIVTSVNEFTYASEPAYQHFPVAGNFRDYMVNVADVPMSFTVQLRDTGSYGYFLPACQLLDTAKENWEGLKYFLHSVASLA